MALTIEDIARLAGVSRGTVDRVIHNRGRVAPEVRERVNSIINECNYRPSKAAQQLAMRNLNIRIGFISPIDQNGFWSILTGSATDYAQDLKEYGISIEKRFFDNTSPAIQLQLIDELTALEISALVIVPMDDEMVIDRLKELSKSIPVIFLTSTVSGCTPLCYVGSDYYVGGRTAAGLMENFKKAPLHILLFNGSKMLSSYTLRRKGFLDEMNAIDSDFTLLESGDLTSDPNYAYQKACKLLKDHPEINAVYTCPDTAASVARAIQDLQLKEKVIHIGHDMTDVTRPYLLNGSISSLIGQRATEQGETPFKLLLDFFTTGTRPAQKEYLMLNDIFIKQNSVF